MSVHAIRQPIPAHSQAGMRSSVFVAAWLFIIAAAVYDSYFAYRFLARAHDLELNPLARLLLQKFDFPWVLTFKAAGLFYGAVLAVYCRRKQNPLGGALTLFVWAAYFILMLHYIGLYR